MSRPFLKINCNLLVMHGKPYALFLNLFLKTLTLEMNNNMYSLNLNNKFIITLNSLKICCLTVCGISPHVKYASLKNFPIADVSIFAVFAWIKPAI